jgi:transposase
VLSRPGARANHVPHGEETAITSLAGTAAPRITVGVDTHLDGHVAHANDQLGCRVDTRSIPPPPPATRTCSPGPAGSASPSPGGGGHRLLRRRPGPLPCRQRPSRRGGQPARRQARRRHGKSDPTDAEAAARAVQAGEATVAPKAGTGQVEMIRSLRVARQTAIRARTQAINAIKALLVTAPVGLREQLRGLPATMLVPAAAALEPGAIISPLAAAMLALRTVAQRYQALDGEITMLTAELDRLAATAAPKLVALFGAGHDSTGALLPRQTSDHSLSEALRRQGGTRSAPEDAPGQLDQRHLTSIRASLGPHAHAVHAGP